MKKVIIIGGGLAGLGAAYGFEHDRRGRAVSYELYEKEERLGGLCRTEAVKGFLFDYTGHLLHFRDDYFKSLLFGLMGKNLIEHSRRAWIYSKKVFTRYPFQANLRGLPPDVIIDCVYEYSKEYFRAEKPPVTTFEDWMIAYFGDGIARHFLVPYNAKLYRRHPREMIPDAAGRFIPSSDLKLLLKGVLADTSAELGYNSTFFYPSQGGIESMVRAIAARVNNVHVAEAIVRVDPLRRAVTMGSGSESLFDALISTQPITELVRSLAYAPRDIAQIARELKHVSVLNVNLGLCSPVGDKHWVYVPEEEYLFHRIGFPTNVSERLAPGGQTSLSLEIGYDPCAGIDVDAAVERSIRDVVKLGVISHSQAVVAVKTITIPYAYVIFDRRRQAAFDTIVNYLRDHGIFSVGRFGSWDYTSMEDAFVQGRRTAIALCEHEE